MDNSIFSVKTRAREGAVLAHLLYNRLVVAQEVGDLSSTPISAWGGFKPMSHNPSKCPKYQGRHKALLCGCWSWGTVHQRMQNQWGYRESNRVHDFSMADGLKENPEKLQMCKTFSDYWNLLLTSPRSCCNFPRSSLLRGCTIKIINSVEKIIINTTLRTQCKELHRRRPL